MLEAAAALGVTIDAASRERAPGAPFPLRPSPEADVDGRRARRGAVGRRQGRAGDAAAALHERSSGRDGASARSATEERAEVERRLDAYARQGLRVLGVARRRLERRRRRPSCARRPSAASPSSGWWRCSTRRARRSRPRWRAATQAGIRVIVVTGDHGLTAAAIAQAGRHRRRRGADGDHRRGARRHERRASSTRCCAATAS